jgi:hypothetical protein
VREACIPAIITVIGPRKRQTMASKGRKTLGLFHPGREARAEEGMRA